MVETIILGISGIQANIRIGTALTPSNTNPSLGEQQVKNRCKFIDDVDHMDVTARLHASEAQTF